MSQEDYQFIDIMNEQTTITESGSYQMPLPFKEIPVLPNNMAQAVKRQEGLYKRFTNDQKLKKEYTTFMEDLINENLAEPVDNTSPIKPGEVWY